MPFSSGRVLPFHALKLAIDKESPADNSGAE